jgi:hypothetical protein
MVADAHADDEPEAEGGADAVTVSEMLAVCSAVALEHALLDESADTDAAAETDKVPVAAAESVTVKTAVVEGVDVATSELDGVTLGRGGIVIVPEENGLSDSAAEADTAADALCETVSDGVSDAVAAADALPQDAVAQDVSEALDVPHEDGDRVATPVVSAENDDVTVIVTERVPDTDGVAETERVSADEAVPNGALAEGGGLALEPPVLVAVDAGLVDIEGVNVVAPDAVRGPEKETVSDTLVETRAVVEPDLVTEGDDDALRILVGDRIPVGDALPVLTSEIDCVGVASPVGAAETEL